MSFSAASTVRKSCVVLCTSGVAVQQWRDQFRQWTTVAEDAVVCFTSAQRRPLPPASAACVLITTYSMMAHGSRRSDVAEEMLASIRAREWGLMLLDEVHVVPASTFRRVLTVCKARPHARKQQQQQQNSKKQAKQKKKTPITKNTLTYQSKSYRVFS